MSLEDRIQAVNRRIEAACRRKGRLRDEVQLIAVTKYGDVAAMADVFDNGLKHVGENRWQHAETKWKQLGSRGIWHFIGHLQTNKVKDVVGKFEYIHSLDRLSLAKELNRKAEALSLTVKTFLQINVAGEDSKFGLRPEDAATFLKEIQEYRHIEVVGLMTMAPHEENSEETRPVFRGLRELRDDLNGQALTEDPIAHLSMGMSNDFEIAVEEGATWLRLGTVLVGK